MRTLDRMRLAAAAAALNKRRGAALPALVLMTDDERLSNPLAAACALPAGSMVIVRARQASHRAKLAAALRPIARARRLRLLIANDGPMADRMKADGVHFAEAHARQAVSWRARRPHWLITISAHSLRACALAAQGCADAAFLSPVFPTGSHPGKGALGAGRARSIARQAPLPVYALGGIEARTAARLAYSGFAGLAGISGLAP